HRRLAQAHVLGALPAGKTHQPGRALPPGWVHTHRHVLTGGSLPRGEDRQDLPLRGRVRLNEPGTVDHDDLRHGTGGDGGQVHHAFTAQHPDRFDPVVEHGPSRDRHGHGRTDRLLGALVGDGVHRHLHLVGAHVHLEPTVTLVLLPGTTHLPETFGP